MTCIKCHEQMSSPQTVAMEGTYKKQTVTVQIAASVCPRCGHKSIEGRLMGEFMQKVADAYRLKRGFLTAGEIRRARERLGMSQAAFATYTGIGLATIKRIELGEIQSKTVDEIIRLKTDREYMETALAAMCQRLAESAQHVQRRQTAGRKSQGQAINNCEALAA